MSNNTMEKIIKKNYDFVVIGGGLAGICTALAAARNGLRTALLQDRPVLGGNSSSEIGIGPNGAAASNRWAMETGIVEEILLNDRCCNHESLSDGGKTNSIYDLGLYNIIISEPMISLYLNTQVTEVHTENISDNNIKQIEAVYAVQSGSENKYLFYAKQFADCTGDGTVGFLAGAESRYGREARSEFDENLAPITADNAVLGSTITMMARNIGKNIPFFPPKWIKDYRNIEEIGINRDIYPPNGENFQGFWWMELSEPYHQINDFNSMRDELLKYVLGVWNYVKNYSDQKEAVKNYALEWIGMLPGKRESRRLMGEVIINQKDCQTDRQWEDRVCFAGWFLDEHIKNGILNKTEPPELSHIDENYANYVMVSPYTIPLRALYSKNISNLWMAGRNISMSHIALCSIRVQNTLGNIGQAVGTAAAYSIKNNLLPYQLLTDSLIHIKNIQQKLIMDDVRIPGIENEDETDLARSAHIISSSSAILDFGQVNTGEFVPLDYPLSQIIPVTENYVEKINFYLKNTSTIEKKY